MEGEIVPPTQRPQAAPAGWLTAYKRFLLSREESFGLKILPLVIVGVVPAVLASDVLLPVLGILEDVPASILVIYTLWRTWRRVRLYR